MKSKKAKMERDGAALLVVLFIVMAVTILSLSFLSRSDAELFCGENMILRAQMDYLADSGLEHARGLILSPQDVAGEYWGGDAGQQLVAGSNDYYDVTVVRDDSDPLNRCNYVIDSRGCRLAGSEKISLSNLQAELRLDPCIAYWQGTNTVIPAGMTVNGDVYSNGGLSNSGAIAGDVFAGGGITGVGISGGRYPNVAGSPVNWPGLNTVDFSSQYYYNGSGPYLVQQIAPGVYSDVIWGTSGGNPAGVYYCDGSLDLDSNVQITGMLVVRDNVRMFGNNNVITAVKSFPALIAGNDITAETAGTGLNVTGLVQVGRHIDMRNLAGGSINVLGGLYVLGGGIVNSSGCTVTVTAFADKAAIEIWPDASTANRWTPAAGAFFKSIRRN